MPSYNSMQGIICKQLIGEHFLFSGAGIQKFQFNSLKYWSKHDRTRPTVLIPGPRVERPFILHFLTDLIHKFYTLFILPIFSFNSAPGRLEGQWEKCFIWNYKPKKDARDGALIEKAMIDEHTC